MTNEAIITKHNLIKRKWKGVLPGPLVNLMNTTTCFILRSVSHKDSEADVIFCAPQLF